MSGNVAIILTVGLWLAVMLIAGAIVSIGMGDSKWNK